MAASQGDNRTLASALRDLGRAQARAGETDAALATLKRGLSASGSEAAVRTELYETIAEIYRTTDRLPELVKQLEAEHPGDYARLALLGGLYEETVRRGRCLAHVRQGTGGQSAADRSAAQDDPSPASAGGARQGDR